MQQNPTHLSGLAPGRGFESLSEDAAVCSPRTGPRLLFFSGGTALRETACELTRYTHNTIHLVTPFDSGGSSAALRKAFAMPAVGDVRARIMALADQHVLGNREIYTLFAYRLPKEDPPRRLKGELVRLVRGTHPLLRQIPAPMGGIIQEHLAWFALHMPEDFPLAGANVGNLVLTAGYLRQNRRLNPVIALFSRMVRAHGIVRPTVDAPAHLAVRLASGEVIVGQHKFTGKGEEGVTSPITDLWLTGSEYSSAPVSLGITPRTARLIRSAEGICYPVGSFYSSVAANLLPSGVGRAVAANPCLKIFVPNLGTDPELLGHSLRMQVERLLGFLAADAPDARPEQLLSLILVDAENGVYPGGIPESWLKGMGIGIRHFSFVPHCGSPLADARKLARALICVHEKKSK